MFLPDFKLKRTRLLSAGVLMLASTAAWSQGNNLFTETQSPPDVKNYSFSEAPTTESFNFITVRAALVAAGTNDIALEVEPGMVVTARQLDFKDNADGTSLWTGTLSKSTQPSDEESDKNEVLLVRHGNNITGSITVDGQLYMVTPLGDGHHAIVKTDVSKFPDYGEDGIEDQAAQGHSHDHGATTESSDHDDHSAHSENNDVSIQNIPIKIRVMSATTNNSRAKHADIPGLVALSIARANHAYHRSKINLELVNAGILDLNVNENGALNAALLGQMNNKSSAIGAPIQKFRDEHLADLAVLLTVATGPCGNAFQPAVKSTGLSAVTGECAAASFTFAHETGHNIGASHEAGYRQTSGSDRWRTIMSSDCSPYCPRIQNFSNPDVNQNGVPTGTINQHNNARTINNRAQNVANFYPAPATWVQSGELSGSTNLPVRQYFEIQLKNRTTGQVLYSLDSIVVDPHMNAWPTATAKAINSYFPADTVRAGERDSNGDINIIEGSSYRNKLWVHHSLSGQYQVQLTRGVYAEAHNQKWVNIGGIESAEQAGTPGTQKLALVKNKLTNQEVARVTLLITQSNSGAWTWPELLARAVNATPSPQMLAGELNAGGSLSIIPGSSYRNRLWVPLDKRSQLISSVENANIDTRGWKQTGDLVAQNDLPARQYFQVQLRDLTTGQMQSAFSLPFNHYDKYSWPTEIGDAIHSRLPANVVRVGEMNTANGTITLIRGSHYRNNLWLSSALDGKLQLQVSRGNYGEALGDKWVSKVSLEAKDATPGTTKVVVVRNTTSNNIVKEVKLAITSANASRFTWMTDLARIVNAETPATLRAGERQADGSIMLIAGSQYRNEIWAPLTQNDQLSVTIVTRDANGNPVN